MAVNSAQRFGILALTVLGVSACDEASMSDIFSGNSASSTAGEEPAASPRASGSVRVVEDPATFDVAETALWDGRPSLGLIWVAYEGADPTNVIIRNEENGNFVVGALYRRERFFPGPPFQLSSDAAAELGILAGNPTQIRVTALTEEAVEPEAPGAVEEEPVEELVQAEEVAPPAASEVSASIDPIAAAAAAIEAADPTTIDAGTVAIPIELRRPTIEGPNAPLPRSVVAPILAPADITPIEPLAVSEPIENPIAPPTSAVSTLNRPFIQVGIFSVEDNAQRAARGLADVGIIAFTEEQRVGGRNFYRVVVGPASNSQERNSLLDAVKTQGFSDAYFVTN